MSLFKQTPEKLRTHYTALQVMYIMSKRMEVRIDSPYIKECMSHSSTDNLAMFLCWVEEHENETNVFVKFRIGFPGIFGLIVSILFVHIGIVTALSQWDVKGLVGLIPFAIFFPIGRFIFALIRRNKLEEIEKILRCY